MKPVYPLNIAIDFDGTICEDNYPNPPKSFIVGAKEAIQSLQKDGHRLYLWTLRRGVMLEDAIRFLSANGIEFYSFRNLSEYAGKPPVDIFVDDKNIGGFIGWENVLLEVTKYFK